MHNDDNGDLFSGEVSGTTGRRHLCLFCFQSCRGGRREGPGTYDTMDNNDMVVSAGACGGGGEVAQAADGQLGECDRSEASWGW